MTERQSIAEAWFRQLRDELCAEFERIEDELAEGEHAGLPVGRFARTPWQRPGGGGGEMGLMKGRVFEKIGVNISTVMGEFDEKFRKEIPGATDHPHFWAAGISLVAHPRSPKIPAVHMNTRHIVLSDGGKPASIGRWWFGGGADLTPCLPNDTDREDFHAALRNACETDEAGSYEKYKQWCDEYFFLKHRNEARGVGGIFYDYLSDDWERRFAFTQSVGRAFAQIYPAIVRRHLHETWTEEDKQAQLKKRGRYVEFNLLYDRGTRFGLMTGGNTEAILMSLPPLASWE